MRLVLFGDNGQELESWDTNEMDDISEEGDRSVLEAVGVVLYAPNDGWEG